MSLLVVTSPHAHGPLTTSQVMKTVLLATLPGLAVLTYYFGPGTLMNVLLRLFDVESGRILIDGQESRQRNVQQLGE